MESPQAAEEVPVPEDPRPSVPGSVVLAWLDSFVFGVLVLAAWGILGRWAVLLSVLGIGIGFALLVRRPLMRNLGLTFHGIQLFHLGATGLAAAIRGNDDALLVLLPLGASVVILLLLMSRDAVGYYEGRDK